jgi:tRNA pseudouridine synthase 10
MNQVPRAKIYIEGRYRKLSRELPQTVFYCPECKGHIRRRRKCERCEGFGKLTRESVQELIGWVAGKAFGTRKNKFHGAGREDVDVRMLGTGRPFVLELIGPRIHDVDLAELEAEINRRNEGQLEILGLHWTEKTRIAYLKETPHAKEYEALVEVDGAVDPERLSFVGERLDVVQHTPERVAHRRAAKDRERWVEFLSVAPEPEQPGHYRVRMRTQHGTYVKEVLSGEDGKTKPSLSTLLDVPCRCVQLDVLGILDAEGDETAEYSAPPVFGAGI